MYYRHLPRDHRDQIQLYKKLILILANFKKLKCSKDILLKLKTSLNNKKSIANSGSRQAKKFSMTTIKLQRIKNILKKNYKT